MQNSFYSIREIELTNQIMQNGYIINPVDDKSILDNLRNKIVKLICENLNCQAPESTDVDSFLENMHHNVLPTELNSLRLFVYIKLN